MEREQLEKKLTILDVMHYIASAWGAVSSDMIPNSFRHCGFKRSHSCSTSEAAVSVDDELKFGSLQLPGTFVDYGSADDSAAVCSAVFLDNIIKAVCPDSTDTSDWEEMDDAGEASTFVLTYVEKADSDLAYSLQAAKTRQRIKEEQMQVQVVERSQEIQVQEQEIMRREKELEATVRRPAEAEKYRLEKMAEANRNRVIMEAEAEAEAIRLKGEAESFAIESKARAEAEQLIKKADAFREYKEAAILDMMLDTLPKLV
ncbi:hypothetical protein HPB50_002735 [Hyalomma asiaticum]|uniref:Uncharacterized protein n=1 Tax=Hyalomma asiaticum TaxID=266040 RepID=A0ACB7TBB3_HYAAI|nr:hypothetical protein HPB50_002735 [Hyalomma asiaticum]